MTIILDASVAIKLVVSEPGTAEARVAALRDEERLAPDWMLAEAASALAHKVRSDGLDAARASLALGELPRFIDRFVPVAPLLDATMKLAVELQHALYDCFYLSVAFVEGGYVLTADDTFYKAARRAGHQDKLQLLS